MLRNLKKRYISWAGIPVNNTQSRKMELSGSYFNQKYKKHIILRPVGQQNDKQFEKAYHFMSKRPQKRYTIAGNGIFWAPFRPKTIKAYHFEAGWSAK